MEYDMLCYGLDWIEVAVEGIDAGNLSRNNDNNASIKMLTFLSCIDILFESVSQLHKVFFNTEDKPFKNDDNIFKEKLFSTSDNKYFKTIRACFAAHQVDLSDYFTGSKQEKRYASWSGGGFGKGDFTVILYSNEIDKPDIFFDIHFSELMEFVIQRYEYLKTIMDEITKKKAKFFDCYRKKLIPQASNPVEQIDILLSETKDRLDNEYYTYELNKLKQLFETQISNNCNLKIVEKYRKLSKNTINEIYNMLQAMEFNELTTLLVHDYGVQGMHRYYYEKLCGYDYWLENSIVKLFSEELEGIVDLSNYFDFNELRVLIDTGLYAKKYPELFAI